jgi:hypothetical protein
MKQIDITARNIMWCKYTPVLAVLVIHKIAQLIVSFNLLDSTSDGGGMFSEQEMIIKKKIKLFL